MKIKKEFTKTELEKISKYQIILRLPPEDGVGLKEISISITDLLSLLTQLNDKQINDLMK